MKWQKVTCNLRPKTAITRLNLNLVNPAASSAGKELRLVSLENTVTGYSI